MPRLRANSNATRAMAASWMARPVESKTVISDEGAARRPATTDPRVSRAALGSSSPLAMGTLTSPATYEQKPENAWERLKGRARKPRDLAVLMEVAAWREHEAQTRDVPRSRVLKDDVLVEIALAAPRDAAAQCPFHRYSVTPAPT